MAPFDFNDLKNKVGEFASTAAGKAKDLASATAAETRRLSRIAKLNLEISAEKDNAKKAYVELGKLYYETHKDAPEGFFAPLCEQAAAAEAAIAEKQAELDELKAKVTELDEPVCDDSDFETVVSETEAAAECTCECECDSGDADAE